MSTPEKQLPPAPSPQPDSVTSVAHPLEDCATVQAIATASPWDDVKPYIPAGYVIDSTGVHIEKTDKEFICGPSWVRAMTRSDQGTDWGLVVHWIDQDGHQQNMAIPACKLSEPRSPIAGDLASMGLKIVPGKERKLMTYLGSFTLPISHRLRSVSQLGWIGLKPMTVAHCLYSRDTKSGWVPGVPSYFSLKRTARRHAPCMAGVL